MQSPGDVRDAQTPMKDQGRTSVSSVSCLRLFLYFPSVLWNHFLKYVFCCPASKNYSFPQQQEGIIFLPNAQFCFVSFCMSKCFVSRCFVLLFFFPHTPTEVQLCTHVNTLKGKKNGKWNVLKDFQKFLLLYRETTPSFAGRVWQSDTTAANFETCSMNEHHVFFLSIITGLTVMQASVIHRYRRRETSYIRRPPKAKPTGSETVAWNKHTLIREQHFKLQPQKNKSCIQQCQLWNMLLNKYIKKENNWIYFTYFL